jgi:hypothetical protein
MKAKHTILSALITCLLLAAGAAPAAESQDPTKAGGCAVCHLGGSGHETAPQLDPDQVARGAHADLGCTACHRGVGLAHGPNPPRPDCTICHQETAAGFGKGVHWKALSELDSETSACVVCHGYHGVLPVDELTSPVNHSAVNSTCGACHEAELKLFNASSHGKALLDPEKQKYAPTCITCHGEHSIFEAAAPASPASPGRQPKTCGSCHDDPQMATALGIEGERALTYGGTVHGLRNRFGILTVATCSDCHGTHLVLPQSDPQSTISQGSLIKTCGRCHPNANENFIAAKIHTQATPENNFGVFAARWFYIIFIGVLAVGFITHITFDFIHMIRRRREGKDGRKQA